MHISPVLLQRLLDDLCGLLRFVPGRLRWAGPGNRCERRH